MTSQGSGSVVLVVFDLDGTITRRDSMMPFVFGYLWRHPSRLWRLARVIPAALAFLGTRDRGALKGALLHQAMGGLSRSEIDRWASVFVSRLLRGGLYAEAVQAIAGHRAAAGHRLVLMSASVDCYVPQIGRALGFDQTICTQVRWNANDSLDGRLASANVRGEEKVRQLTALQRHYSPREIHAYGNSTADLPHLRLATVGFFVNGDAAAIPADCPQIKAVEWRCSATV